MAVLRKVATFDYDWFEYRNTRKGISTGLMSTPAQLSASTVTKTKKDQNLLPPHAHASKLIAHIACYPVLAAHDYYTKKLRPTT